MEEAVAGSSLFDERLPDETKQEYRERQDRANAFLAGKYEEYYIKYLQQLHMQHFEDLSK
jgi:hypothetical protein